MAHDLRHSTAASGVVPVPRGVTVHTVAARCSLCSLLFADRLWFVRRAMVADAAVVQGCPGCSLDGSCQEHSYVMDKAAATVMLRWMASGVVGASAALGVGSGSKRA